MMCANRHWHIIGVGHRSKCYDTVLFKARCHLPHTAYFNALGGWTTLACGTYDAPNGVTILTNGLTV